MLNCVPPPQKKKRCWHPKCQYLRTWPHFQCCCRFKIKSYWSMVGPSPSMIGVLIRGKTLREHHPITEEELGWCRLGHASDGGQSPGVRKSQGRISLHISKAAWPYCHLDFRLLASNTLRLYMFVVLSHSVQVLCYSGLSKLIKNYVESCSSVPDCVPPNLFQGIGFITEPISLFPVFRGSSCLTLLTFCIVEGSHFAEELFPVYLNKCFLNCVAQSAMSCTRAFY